MKPKRINLRIEKLVLQGFAPGAHRSIGTVMKQQLTRLLSERGLNPSLSGKHEIASIDGGHLNMTPNTKTDVIGNRLAQTIYKGVNR